MNPEAISPLPARFFPVRFRLLAVQSGITTLLLAITGFSLYRLAAFPPDIGGGIALIGLFIAFLALPALIYRIAILLRSGYQINPNNSLTIRFGSCLEIIPIDEIAEIRSGGGISSAVRSSAPGWVESWHGYRSAAGEIPVDWFATDNSACLLLLVTKNRLLALSPKDPSRFAHTITELSTRGSLERVTPVSVQPRLLFHDIAINRPAMILLLTGLTAVVTLGVLVLGLLPSLPANQFFKFDPSGKPASEGDPVRLLLLPLAGGLTWLLNALLGWLAWRKKDPPAAYTFWLISCLVAAGLWASTLALIWAK